MARDRSGSVARVRYRHPVRARSLSVRGLAHGVEEFRVRFRHVGPDIDVATVAEAETGDVERVSVSVLRQLRLAGLKFVR